MRRFVEHLAGTVERTKVRVGRDEVRGEEVVGG